MQTHSDTGTVIPNDSVAIAASLGGNYQLLVPHSEGEGEVSDIVLAFTAIFLRLEQDPDFIPEQLEWLSAASRA